MIWSENSLRSRNKTTSWKFSLNFIINWTKSNFPRNCAKHMSYWSPRLLSKRIAITYSARQSLPRSWKSKGRLKKTRRTAWVAGGALLRKVPVIETRAAMPHVGCRLAGHSRWLVRGLEVALDQRVFLKRVSSGSSNSKLRTPRRWGSCQREDSRHRTKIKKSRRMLIIIWIQTQPILTVQLRMHPKAATIPARSESELIGMIWKKLSSAHTYTRRTARTTKDLTTRSRRTKRSTAKWQIKSARIANAARTATEAACCLEHRSR